MKTTVSRRTFVTSLGMALAAGTAVMARHTTQDKREALMSLRKGGAGPDHVLGAFFVHFGAEYRFGTGAVEKHLEFFRFTGMDFVKVQYEATFPPEKQIVAPGDWKKMPRHGLDFYKAQLEVIGGLVRAARRDAPVIATIYSPFMCAGHASSRATVAKHLMENPEAVRPGLATITESLLLFVRECRKLGVDGFYMCTQGAEQDTFRDRRTFEDHVRPFDLELFREIDATCAFNILHVCDFEARYADLAPVLQYPGHVVSCSPRFTGGLVPMGELARQFGRPVMGGMDRLGALASGTSEQVAADALAVLEKAPSRFILGADCTVPGSNRWEAIRAAIATAHAYRRG
jgi:uroporphyrinogen decarboxylase